MAFSTDTGLGNQTYALFTHLEPAKTLVVDISSLNGMPTHHERYPGARITNGLPTTEDCAWLLEDIDLVFVCETPLNYALFRMAKEQGVKTILQYNFEFLDYFQDPSLPKPTVFAAPSQWNIEKMTPKLFPNLISLPVPVDTDLLPKREIEKAATFFHIAGRPAIHDRNGTGYFIEAAKIAKERVPEANFIIYCQNPSLELIQQIHSSPVRLVTEVPNYADLYKEGDILVIPRRFGGLCLPCQEAIGCGIPVLMPDIDPNNRFLPKEWLFDVLPEVESFQTRTKIDLYTPDVLDIARMMVSLYQSPELVQKMHHQAKDQAKWISWHALIVKYTALINNLCT